jgi:hypothetical protein
MYYIDVIMLYEIHASSYILSLSGGMKNSAPTQGKNRETVRYECDGEEKKERRNNSVERGRNKKKEKNLISHTSHTIIR